MHFWEWWFFQLKYTFLYGQPDMQKRQERQRV